MCEDKNDIFAVHDNTLISKSPILFLNSSSFTIEEKYALARNYISGLHLSLLQNSYGNHDIKIKNSTSNYFEIGKHANECHDKYNDPPYKQYFANLHASNGYIVKFYF